MSFRPIPEPIENPDGSFTIPLTQGLTALVDACDADRVGKHRWHAQRRYGTDVFYAQGHRISMHRFILGDEIPDGLMVDHINRNPLDNRRVNLRFADQYQNQYNRNVQRGKTSSKYVGVAWIQSRRKWRAFIKAKGNHRIIGEFDNEIEAARARDNAAIELHGEFATLNLPCHKCTFPDCSCADPDTYCDRCGE